MMKSFSSIHVSVVWPGWKLSWSFQVFVFLRFFLFFYLYRLQPASLKTNTNALGGSLLSSLLLPDVSGLRVRLLIFFPPLGSVRYRPPLHNPPPATGQNFYRSQGTCRIEPPRLIVRHQNNQTLYTDLPFQPAN